jgi:hypothetical protein
MEVSERVDLLEVTMQIIRLKDEIYRELGMSGELDTEKSAMLAALRDYCLFLVLDVLNEGESEEAQRLIETLTRCEAYSNDCGDQFHAGFFFTLTQLLSLQHDIKRPSDESIERLDFEESWRRTRKMLGL